jgi:hypothetical protein
MCECALRLAIHYGARYKTSDPALPARKISILKPLRLQENVGSSKKKNWFYQLRLLTECRRANWHTATHVLSYLHCLILILTLQHADLFCTYHWGYFNAVFAAIMTVNIDYSEIQLHTFCKFCKRFLGRNPKFCFGFSHQNHRIQGDVC